MPAFLAAAAPYAANAAIAALPFLLNKLGGGAKASANQSMGQTMGPMMGGGGLLGQPAKGASGTYTPISTRTGPQQQVTNQALQNLLGGLQSGQFSDFQPYENQARENFSRKTIPMIAERFTAFGSGPGSSAFQGALQGAGSQLETNLAALRSQHNMNYGNFLNTLGMGSQYDVNYEADEPGFGRSFLSGAGNLLSNPEMWKLLLQAYQGTGGAGEQDNLMKIIQSLINSQRGNA